MNELLQERQQKRQKLKEEGAAPKVRTGLAAIILFS